LGCHWMYRGAVEKGLERLKRYWEGWRPDIPFPLEVGEGYTGPRTSSVSPDAMGLVTESLNALALASGTSTEE